jgi:hypothetical protein
MLSAGIDAESESDASERIVIANGMDIDKQYFYEVTKRISRDWDIRKLSLLGPPLWAALSLAFLFWAGRGLIQGGRAWLLGIGGTASELLSNPVPILVDNALYVLLAAAALVYFVKPALDLVRFDLSLKSNVRTVANNLTSLLNVFAWDVWQNLNYWHPFTSNLSDRDPLVVLSDEADAEVSGVYADGPHYGNVFVDSVYVDFEGEAIGLRHWLLARLYDHRMKPFRRAVLAGVGLVVGLWSLDRFVAANLTPFADIIPWTALVLLALAIGVLELLAVALTGYPGWHARFYADSAGLSEYDRLLNEPDMVKPTESDKRLSLSNSMSGYGLFYVSEFLKQLIGDHQYHVDVDAAALAPSDDDEASSSFPALGFTEAPEDEHAVSAASELLWSSVPAASVRSGEEAADVTIRLQGIDYRTTGDRPASWWRRRREGLSNRLDGYFDESNAETREKSVLQKPVAGERTGIRLPVKKFMSVPHGQTAAAVEKQPDSDLDLFVHDGWDEEKRHYLLLGGGEHQQGINKLVLSLKAEGYENVDVLENAFSGTGTDVDGTGDRVYDSALFPTEYFVSFVGGDSEFFRQDDHGFLLLRHELHTEDGRTEWVYVLIGMSAVGTKVGFLYWLDQYERDEPFAEIDEDVVHFVTHAGPTDFEGIDDIGHLYLDTDWRETGGLEFDLSEDESYESVHPGTSSEESGDRKRLGMEYYDLNLEYNASSS